MIKNFNWFRVFLFIYAIFYVIAGFNHFRVIENYLTIMPDWIPLHRFLVYLSGIVEIFLGILLLFSKTRKIASLLIILMLIAFLPVHIYMIKIAPFQLGNTYITPFLAWLRLPLQLFLIIWGYYYYKKQKR